MGHRAMRTHLFLNLDGVVHPRQMQYALLRGYPHIGPHHFCWADSLRQVLDEWDAVVVLRSSAVSMFGLDAVKGLAPPWLSERIEGTTTEIVRFIALFEARRVNTAFGVVRRYVQEHGVQHWVVLSDDHDGWPDPPDVRRHLVECDGSTGLSDPMLARRLSLAFSECAP